MSIIIGCPVFQREWILPLFFKSIENQNYPLSKIGFIFIVEPQDTPTIDSLYTWHSSHPEVNIFDVVRDEDEIHRAHPDEQRVWDWQKYYTMISLRNKLLSQVRVHNPDRFFSLDSDIILENSNTITELIQLTATLDAVSPLMYMTPEGIDFPGVMTWENEPGLRAIRNNPYPMGKLFQADVIMAAKMMSRQVYQNVNYTYHRQGEDLGFCHEAAKQGYKLYNASYLYTPHIMSKNGLTKYLDSGDPRSDFPRTL